MLAFVIIVSNRPEAIARTFLAHLLEFLALHTVLRLLVTLDFTQVQRWDPDRVGERVTA